MKILIVEDDRAVAESLQLLFSTYHYSVDLAADSATGLAMTDAFEYDLILLDVLLPDGDGIDLCQQLRSKGLQCPILLLTGQRDSQKKATALNVGADDYVTKPFDPAELIARVQALLRRGELNHASTLAFDGLSMDPSSHRVAYRDQLLTLPPKAYAILELLLRNPEKSFTSETILSRVWTSLEMPGEETVRVHIKDLRQKLTALGAPKDLIKTQHRRGYRLNPLYATTSISSMVDRLTPPQIAELNATNETLRSTMEELRSSQAELQQKNQELQAARDELEQRVTDRTAELSQREAFLRESESLLRLTLSSVQAGSWDWDIESDQLTWNDRLFELLGYRLGEVIPSVQAWRDRIHPDDLEWTSQALQQTLEKRRVREVEYRVIHPDGSLHWLLVKGQGIYDAADRPVRMVGIALEITDRKRREAKTTLLSEITASFSDQLSPHEIIQAVGEKLYAYLNIAACSFCEIDEVHDQVVYLGRWHREETTHLPDRLCLSEQVSQAFLQQIRTGETLVSHNTQTNTVTNAEANEAIGVQAFITVPFFKNGEWKYLFSIHENRPRTWQEDEIELVCEVANCTVPRIERAHTEIALRHNQEVLRLAMAGAQAGSWDWVLATGQLTWSPETYRLHGLDPTAPLPEYEGWYENCLHPDDRALVNHYITQVVEQRQSDIHLEFRVLHPQKGIRWILSLGHLIVNGQGEPVRMSGINLDISDRKQSEEQLQLSRAKFEALVTNMPGMVYRYFPATPDKPHHFSFVSQQTVELLELTPETIIQDANTLVALIHPDDLASFFNAINHSVEHFLAWRWQGRIVTPSGQLKWIQGTSQAQQTPEGDAWDGLLIDISDRKQAELTLEKQIQQEYLLNEIAQEIRRSLQVNDVLFSTVHQVRAFLETDRVIFFRFRPNWEGEVIMESVGDELMSILSTNIFDPCFSDRYIEPYRQGRISTISDVDRADLQPCYIELLKSFQVRANLVVPILVNEMLWGLLIAHHCTAPREWQAAEIALLQRLSTQVSIAIQQAELYQNLQTELTERQQAEQKIREQAALLDISSDAIFVRDLEHRILYWNQGAERLYGWTAAEAIGQKVTELMHDNETQTAEIFQTVLTTGEWQGEIHKFTRTGQELIIQARWILMRDQAGQPKSILTINTDITEKKNLEAQFYHAQRLESLGTLASGIAHDLNNVLTPIVTLSQLLRLHLPNMDERSQHMLKLLEDSSKRGAGIVKQILAFNRGTEGERQPVEVTGALQEVVDVARQTFPKSIDLYQATIDSGGDSEATTPTG